MWLTAPITSWRLHAASAISNPRSCHGPLSLPMGTNQSSTCSGCHPRTDTDNSNSNNVNNNSNNDNRNSNNDSNNLTIVTIPRSISCWSRQILYSHLLRRLFIVCSRQAIAHKSFIDSHPFTFTASRLRFVGEATVAIMIFNHTKDAWSALLHIAPLFSIVWFKVHCGLLP